jgi:recombination protein RecA
MRAEALAFAASMNKRLNKTAIVRASDMVIPRRYTSGSLSLDVALGGGWPGNQWVEVLGKESSGKTAMTLKTVAANQRNDPEFTTFWLAAEHYDSSHAAALGVDNDRMSVAPLRKMEEALDLLLDATGSKAYDLVVCDSFPALLPREEGEKLLVESVVSPGARVFNRFWRAMGEASYRDPLGTDRAFTGIMINQWRDKVGAFSPRGTPQTSPGGHGKDYAYYVRADISRDEWITEGDLPVGQVMKIKLIKNKSAAPQQIARVSFYFADAPSGFRRGDYDLGSEYVTMGIVFGIIERNGAWYQYGGQKWNGKDAVQAAVRSEPTLALALRDEVLAAAKATT